MAIQFTFIRYLGHFFRIPDERILSDSIEFRNFLPLPLPPSYSFFRGVMFSFFRRSRKDPKESGGAKANVKKEKKNRTASASASDSESASSQCLTPKASARAIPAPAENDSLVQFVNTSIPVDSTGAKSSNASAEPKLTVSEKSIPPPVESTLGHNEIADASTEAKISNLDTECKQKSSTPERSVPIAASLIPVKTSSGNSIPAIPAIMEPISTANQTLISPTKSKNSLPELSVRPKLLIQQQKPEPSVLVSDDFTTAGSYETKSLAPENSTVVESSVTEEDDTKTFGCPISLDVSSQSATLISDESIPQKFQTADETAAQKTLQSEESSGTLVSTSEASEQSNYSRQANCSTSSSPVESTVQHCSVPDTAIKKSSSIKSIVKKTRHPNESSEIKVSIPDVSLKLTTPIPENSSVPDDSFEQHFLVPETTIPGNSVTIRTESNEHGIVIPDAPTPLAPSNPDVSARSAISIADVETVSASLSNGMNHDPINSPECGSDSKIHRKESRVKRVHFAPHPCYDTFPPSPPTDANFQVDFHRIWIQSHLFYCGSFDSIDWYKAGLYLGQLNTHSNLILNRLYFWISM